ncbi:MAG: hypothetical protein KatS3mg076_1739 [Candidatus Binatia bacterium]|nr:MAG: hypothetical protein KatS3mg076_1739 [Candidatus Binatia bacterium]
MRFLADESCDFAVVRALRNDGHDVAAVAEDQPGATDDVVVSRTLHENLTEDKDFGRLVFASGKTIPGVLLLRFPASSRMAMVDTVLKVVRSEAAKIAGRFVVVQPGRVRVSLRRRGS